MTPFGFVVIVAGLLFASCALVLALWGPVFERRGRASRLRGARKWAEQHTDEPARYGEPLPEPLASLTAADLSADPAARELVHRRLREAAQSPPEGPTRQEPDLGDLPGAQSASVSPKGGWEPAGLAALGQAVVEASTGEARGATEEPEDAEHFLVVVGPGTGKMGKTVFLDTVATRMLGTGESTSKIQVITMKELREKAAETEREDG